MTEGQVEETQRKAFAVGSPAVPRAVLVGERDAEAVVARQVAQGGHLVDALRARVEVDERPLHDVPASKEHATGDEGGAVGDFRPRQLGYDV